MLLSCYENEKNLNLNNLDTKLIQLFQVLLQLVLFSDLFIIQSITNILKVVFFFVWN